VTALDVLKIIISTNKVQIGPHISSDVVHLLFTIAEMGAESDSVFHRYEFHFSVMLHIQFMEWMFQVFDVIHRSADGDNE